MTVISNFIKCRYCNWKTAKWGYGSTPQKAFNRLSAHIECDHPAIDDQFWHFREQAEEHELEYLEDIA